MQLNVRDIVELQAQRDNPMVSIFVPLTPHQPRQATIALRNLLREAERRLNLEFTPAEVKPLLAGLRDRAASADLTRGRGSVAFFASGEGTRIISLPYDVEPEVVVDETFATRNLVHALQRAQRYLVAVIDEGAMRCFEVVGATAVELDDYALSMIDDLRPGAGWQGPFARKVDELLDARQTDDPLPVILLAPPGMEAAFLKRSLIRRHVIASATGRFEGAATERVRDVALRLVKQHVMEDLREVFRRLAEAHDGHRMARGIHEVWEVAGQGRISLLVVEHSFRFPATLESNGSLVEVGDASSPGVMDDAVDEVVEIALRHDAELRFLPDGDLGEWGRIVAITRW